MTTENKVIAGVGGLLLVVGGIVIWNKRKSNNETENIDTQRFLDQPSKEPVRIQASTTKAPTTPSKPQSAKVIPDGISFRVGQRVMAGLKNGVPVYDVNKAANGDYFSKRINIKRFNYGQEIGEIIYVGKMPDGTYRYAVKSPTGLNRELYWTDHKSIKPIGAIIPPKQTVRSTAGLDMNLMLYRGLYNSKEVEELQKRLNLTVDGDFGQNTEKALLSVKKVKVIKLKDF